MAERKFQHTPGTWFLNGPDQTNAFDWLVVRRGKGYDIMPIALMICESYQESQANARLTAAAPNLLRSAMQSLELLIESGFDGSDPTTQSLMQAVAEARGMDPDDPKLLDGLEELEG